MSGQFPVHQPQSGEVPVTMDNFSNWNAHQQPQGGVVLGHNTTLGSPQSGVHGGLPQPQAPPFRQVPGSPSKALKFVNISHNGSGMPLSTSSSNPSAQTSTLTDNLRHNLHVFMNQGTLSPSKSSVINSATPLVTIPSGSKDLSHPSKQLVKVIVSEPAPFVSHLANKEPSLTNQNFRGISSTGLPGTFNGEVNTRNSTGISVISNVFTSAKSVPKDESVKQGNNGKEPGVNVKISNDAQVGLNDIASFAKKRELLLKESTVMSYTSAEPPLKKIKEDVSCSSVIINSTNSSVTNSSKELQIKDEKMPVPPSVSSSSASKQDALDVESQLEALFAGIADGNSSKESKLLSESPSNLQGTPNIADVLESKGSASKKGKGKTNGLSKGSDAFGTLSTESTPKKKVKKKSTKDKPWEDARNKKSKKGVVIKGKYVKEASCDSGSNISSSRARGPVVHVQGLKDAPTSLVVINVPSRQDDEENDNKKKGLSTSRVRKSHTIEGKLSSNGLCGNSLVSRYEAHSSDPRWVCVFCKRGCHVEGLGDLFGPYLVSHDLDLENSLELEADGERKIGDKKDKKNKRSGMGQTGVLGLLAIPPLQGEQPQFMVWFHENCAVWSPTINLIGSRLAGLQEAVWVAVHSKCCKCLNDGANIGCVHHGCSRQIHYPCAQDESWLLNNDTFISTCHIHKMLGNSMLPSTSSVVNP